MGRRGKEGETAAACGYERLVEEAEERAPKGYVPVLVGEEGMVMVRFLVHVRLFGDPCIAALLDMAADQLGHKREGVLRIPCDADHFRRVVSEISKSN